MPDQRSLIAVERVHEGGRRFDYFVLGIVVALCAYAGQTIKPERFGWTPYTIEALSVVVLVASAFCGFKRIEKKVKLDELHHVILDGYEKKGAIIAHQTNKPGKPFVNAGTGDIYSPEDLEAKKKEIETELSQWHNAADAVHNCAQCYGKFRDGLLAVGFIGVENDRERFGSASVRGCSPTVPRSLARACAWNGCTQRLGLTRLRELGGDIEDATRLSSRSPLKFSLASLRSSDDLDSVDLFPPL